MMELLRPLLDSALNPIREAISRMARSAAELALVGIFALLGLGFLIAALTAWLAHTYGTVTATLIMAGVSFALMIVVLVIWYASTASDRKKREEEAKRKQDERLRSAARGPSSISSFINLLGLASTFYGRRKRRREEKLHRQARSTTQSVADESRRLAITAEEKARQATKASRSSVRSAMDGVGPWTVMSTAALGGLLTVLVFRRRKGRR
jgi:uncharacterized membrane protein